MSLRPVAERAVEATEARGVGVHLQLLNGFKVTVGSQAMEVPDGSQRLLVYLALRDLPQSRPLVAASLWPEKGEARAGANLRSCLWRLPSAHDAPLVCARGSTLRLSPDVRVDIRLAEQLGWSLIRDPSLPLDEIDRRLFFQELLPGWYDDWVILERERFEQLKLHFLEALTYALTTRSRHAEALDVALHLVAADPLRERSQRALITVYCDEGSLGQARRQLARYQKLIVETFGCEPSAEFMRMIDDRC